MELCMDKKQRIHIISSLDRTQVLSRKKRRRHQEASKEQIVSCLEASKRGWFCHP